MIGRSAAIALVAGSYALLVGILVLIVVAVTTALADGRGQQVQADAVVDAAPQFSADGTQIAFLRTGDGPARLWVMDDDGSDPRPVARATRFAWSRGHVLLFERGGRLWRVGAGGGNPRPTRGTLAAPRTTSRGRTVFVRNHHVYVRDARGAAAPLT